jgi:hypothetical protein
MRHSSTEELKIKAKLLVKQKRAAREEISLGQALDIMAVKKGHDDWRAFKESANKGDLYYPSHFSARMNVWFANYEEAAKVLAQQPDNYLLPYRKQFFICLPEYVEAFGIAPDDPDLLGVEHDWVNPNDAKAFIRLNDKIRESWKKNSWN